MKLTDYKKYFNCYYGRQWIKANLPQQPQIWMMGPYKMSVEKDSRIVTSLPCSIKAHLQYDSWQWPRRVIYFFSDIHADTDAFVESLVASGGIQKTGPQDKDFKLTPEGKKARFILGGDCFDKGPSTLRLLRMIRRLLDKGADVIILAGNHDTRSLVGMVSLMMKRTVATEHLFIRMGRKPLPLFREIHLQYLDNKKSRKKLPDEKTCRKLLFPSTDWEKNFTRVAQPLLSDSAINKDIKNTRKKADNFEQWSLEHDLTLPQVYAAAKKWRQLFLHPKGEFFWFLNTCGWPIRKDPSFLCMQELMMRLQKWCGTKELRELTKCLEKNCRQIPLPSITGRWVI